MADDTPVDSPMGAPDFSKPEKDYQSIMRMLMQSSLEQAGFRNPSPEILQSASSSLFEAMREIAGNIAQTAQQQPVPPAFPDVFDSRGRLDIGALGNLTQDQAQLIKDSPLWGTLGYNAQRIVGRAASGTFEFSGKEDSSTRDEGDFVAEDSTTTKIGPDEPDVVIDKPGFRPGPMYTAPSSKESDFDYDKALDEAMRLARGGPIPDKSDVKWTRSPDSEVPEWYDNYGEMPQGMKESRKFEDNENVLDVVGRKFEEEHKFRRVVIDLFRRLIFDNANDNAELQSLRRMLEQSRTAL